MPEVSIIVPCYKANAYVPDFIRALQSQDFKGAWEAVFVDDGDSDGATLEKLVKAADLQAGGMGRYRIVHKQNGGVSSARNFGIESSTGEIILFADPDDTMSPTWISTLVSGIEGVDLAWGTFGITKFQCSNVRMFECSNEGKAVFQCSNIRSYIWRAVFGYRLRDLPKALLPGGIWKNCHREWGVVWARAFRRKVLKDLRFDESLSLNEDALFLAEYALRANSMRIIGDTGYNYHFREGGAVGTLSREKFVPCKFALRNARRRIDPKMTHWRGTYLVSAFQILCHAGIRTAWHYLTEW